MTTPTNYPESPEGSATTNCPHCGAELVEGVTNSWICGSWLHAESGAGRKADLCRERAARQKAEAERDEMEARAMGLVLHLPDDITCGEIRRWRDEAKAKLAALAATQNLAADQTVRLAKLATELAETRKELEEFIQTVERDHFRTIHDSGAHPNALMIWNRVRDFAGMTELRRSDLPAPCEACHKYHRAGECLAEAEKGGAS